MALTVDTRTATDYGVVRTFAQADFQFNNFGTQNGNTPVDGPWRWYRCRRYFGGIQDSWTAGQLSGLNGSLPQQSRRRLLSRSSSCFIQFAGFNLR